MAYCLTHKLFFTQKCPRCQPRNNHTSDKAERPEAKYRSSDPTTRDRAIQLLETSIANTNRACQSHHALRVEQDELVMVFCISRNRVTFVHAPLSPDLWGEILNTLNRSNCPGTHKELQAVMETMQSCGGKKNTFRL